ncbi:MAG: acyltransferase [Allomuricauda sp.]
MKSSNYIETLTPLRGIAAIWVVLYHYDQLTTFTGLEPLVSQDSTMLMAKGYLFVDFFFLLSGFILAHVYGDRFQHSINFKSSWNYLWARFSRLYPLHIFCLLTHVVVAFFLIFGFPNVWDKFSHMYAFKGIPVHLFLAQAWGSDYWLTWNVPSWSISAEWAIYMASPLLFLFLFQRKGSGQWIMALISFAILGGIVHFNVKHSLDVTFDWGIFRCFAEFTLGILVYNLYRKSFFKKWLAKDLFFLAMALMTLFGLHIKINDVFIIPCFALIILTAAHNRGKVQQMMKWPPAQFLGEISYSIYMMQGLWLSLYWMGLDSWLMDRPGLIPDTWTLVPLVMSLLFVNIVSAAWSYQNIEIPFQQKLRKIKFKQLLNFQ